MDDALDDLVAELENVGNVRVTGRLMCSGQDWVATADGLPPSNLRLLSIVVDVWKGAIDEVVPSYSRTSLRHSGIDVAYVIDRILNEITFTPRLDIPRPPQYTISLIPG